MYLYIYLYIAIFPWYVDYSNLRQLYVRLISLMSVITSYLYTATNRKTHIYTIRQDLSV